MRRQSQKKTAETDAVFEQVHKVNKLSDETEGVLRLSADCKATIKVGPFSRGGYSRQGAKACDHDFAPEKELKLFGIYLPVHYESFLYFTEGNITADFMTDMPENLWPEIRERFNPHTLTINADNGSENSSVRTQFIRRLVEFSRKHGIGIESAYYPPYHSKYNPIERLWGISENHRNGELLDNTDKILGLARTMTYKGKNPVVHFIKDVYKTGVKLTEKIMQTYESLIHRLPGLEKWFVSVPFYED